MEIPLVILLAFIMIAATPSGIIFATTSSSDEDQEEDEEQAERAQDTKTADEGELRLDEQKRKDALTMNYDEDTCVFNQDGFPIYPFTIQCPDIVRDPDDPPAS